MTTLLHFFFFFLTKMTPTGGRKTTSKGLQMRLLRSGSEYLTGQESRLSHTDFAVKNTPVMYFYRQARKNVRK